MTNVTQILSGIESGDPTACEQLRPLVYEELLEGDQPLYALAHLRLEFGDSQLEWASPVPLFFRA